MTNTDSFEPGQPSAKQQIQLETVRAAAKAFSEALDKNLPSGPDKAFVFRTFRTAVMWASVAIMRNIDGTLRN